MGKTEISFKLWQVNVWKATQKGSQSLALYTEYTLIKGEMIIMQKKKHDYLRVRDSLKDLHLQIQKQNKSKTPKELGMDDRFEDCPKAINEIQYGRVFRKATTVQKGGVSSIYDNMD